MVIMTHTTDTPSLQLKPFVLISRNGEIYDVIKTTRKAAEKSLEMGVLWIIHPQTGSLVEHKPQVVVYSLQEKDTWFEARIQVQEKATLPNKQEVRDSTIKTSSIKKTDTHSNAPKHNDPPKRVSYPPLYADYEILTTLEQSIQTRSQTRDTEKKPKNETKNETKNDPEKNEAPHVRTATSTLQDNSASDGSYTAHLLRRGPKHIKKKLIEEAGEVALSVHDQELLNESADLVYHLLVLLHACGYTFGHVIEVLGARAKNSNQDRDLQ